MNKKKLVAVLTTITIVGTLLAGCSSSKSSTSSTGTTDAKQIKVGLSTDEGGLNDKSFNQAADAGIKKAETDLGVSYKAIQSVKPEDYEPNLKALLDNGSDIVFGVGYKMETAIEGIAKQNPTKKFAIVDSGAFEDPKAATPKQISNVESIMFKENEGSYLVGIIAGKMTKTHKIGFIGGYDSDLIEKFSTGFTAGVKSVDPEAAKGLIDGKTIQWANSFADSNKGYEAAKTLISSGCDVIYHAAGGVGVGMFKAVKEANEAGNKVWAIGVDMDQATNILDENKKPIYADIILTSMMKRVDTGTYTVVKDVKDNQFKGGTTLTLGLKEDGVGIAPSSNKNTPQDVLDLVKKYSDAIVAGKIVVPAKKGEAASFVAPTDIK